MNIHFLLCSSVLVYVTYCWVLLKIRRISMGFFIWTLITLIFVYISITIRKSNIPVNLFTFGDAPKVNDIKRYNKAVSNLWLVFTILFEMIGISLLFIKQNSPLVILIVLGVVFLVIGMMVMHTKIESKYRV